MTDGLLPPGTTVKAEIKSGIAVLLIWALASSVMIGFALLASHAFDNPSPWGHASIKKNSMASPTSNTLPDQSASVSFQRMSALNWSSVLFIRPGRYRGKGAPDPGWAILAAAVLVGALFLADYVSK